MGASKRTVSLLKSKHRDAIVVVKLFVNSTTDPVSGIHSAI